MIVAARDLFLMKLGRKLERGEVGLARGAGEPLGDPSPRANWAVGSAMWVGRCEEPGRAMSGVRFRRPVWEDDEGGVEETRCSVGDVAIEEMWATGVSPGVDGGASRERAEIKGNQSATAKFRPPWILE